MSLLMQFDMAIKTESAPAVSKEDGYRIDGKQTNLPYNAYEEYYSWKKFIDEMKELYPEAYKKYSSGAGGELFQKKNRPPKMASYASSSRMIYLLARNRKGFEFEKELPFVIENVETTPFLDGYLKTENENIYVEAKCREPYTLHSKVTVSDKYLKLYEYIQKASKGYISFVINRGIKCKNGYVSVSFIAGENKIERFDLKQMISHLMGISNAVINEKNNITPIKFLYLLYNPSALEIEPKYKDKIMKIYNKTCKECNSVNFKELFRIILDYSAKEKGLNVKTNADIFDFELCDQNEFMEKIYYYDCKN